MCTYSLLRSRIESILSSSGDEDFFGSIGFQSLGDDQTNSRTTCGMYQLAVVLYGTYSARRRRCIYLQ